MGGGGSISSEEGPGRLTLVDVVGVRSTSATALGTNQQVEHSRLNSAQKSVRMIYTINVPTLNQGYAK